MGSGELEGWDYGSSRVSPAVCWASWADCLHTVHLRHPVLGDQIEAALSRGEPGQHLQAAMRCREQLLDVGMEAPPWEDLIRGVVPRNDLDDAEPGVKHWWQFQATQKVEDCYLSGAMWPRLSGPSRALLRSQGGPMDGLPFTSFPTAVHSRFDGPCSPLAPSLAPFALFRSQLPVWLSTRFQWPPPCSLRGGRGSGAKGLCGGKRTSMSGSGRQSFVERASARHGFGSAGRVGQPSTGDCGECPSFLRQLARAGPQ